MDELTDDEVVTLQAALVALKAKLKADLARDSDSADIVDLETPQGRLSRMDAMQQQKMAQAQKRRMKSRLSKVNQALKAIEEDEYGDCRLCSEPIGVRRLTVRPESLLCVSCTEAAEKRRR